MPVMRIYDTLTRRKEAFRPLSGKTVKLYTCGPTVYDPAHIGNLRTFLFEDFLRRALRYFGYGVKHVMNITDVDDKIIRRAIERGISIATITRPLEKRFFADAAKLNILPADHYPRATAYVKEMVANIEKLVKNGFAYVGDDGSVYFGVSRFKTYGKLSRLQKRSIRTGARVEADEYGKDEAQDFVLWKKQKPGEPSWPSPWGRGRPGWHIECSAMSTALLGPTIDIHAGGVDLIFPHHENEIAQSEGATRKPFVRRWMHGEFLLVDGKKMSKSLGNFYTLEDIKRRGVNPLAYRYLVASAHYRSQLNFTWDSLAAASSALANMSSEVRRLASRASLRGASKKAAKGWRAIAERHRARFEGALANDLNVPEALAASRELMQDASLPPFAKLACLKKFDLVLGLGLAAEAEDALKIPAHVRKLLDRRERLRSHKQFIQSDALRKRAEGLGYSVEDSEDGAIVWRNAKR